MKIVTREEVVKDLIAVPGKLEYDFYIKEVCGNEVCYSPYIPSNV